MISSAPNLVKRRVDSSADQSSALSVGISIETSALMCVDPFGGRTSFIRQETHVARSKALGHVTRRLALASFSSFSFSFFLFSPAVAETLVYRSASGPPLPTDAGKQMFQYNRRSEEHTSELQSPYDLV